MENAVIKVAHYAAETVAIVCGAYLVCHQHSTIGAWMIFLALLS